MAAVLLGSCCTFRLFICTCKVAEAAGPSIFPTVKAKFNSSWKAKDLLHQKLFPWHIFWFHVEMKKQKRLPWGNGITEREKEETERCCIDVLSLTQFGQRPEGDKVAAPGHREQYQRQLQTSTAQHMCLHVSSTNPEMRVYARHYVPDRTVFFLSFIFLPKIFTRTHTRRLSLAFTYLHGGRRLAGEERPQVQQHLVDVRQHQPQQPHGILLPDQVAAPIAADASIVVALHTFTPAFFFTLPWLSMTQEMVLLAFFTCSVWTCAGSVDRGRSGLHTTPP